MAAGAYERENTMDARIEELQEKMRKKLTVSRFEHTMGVMYTAAALAMAHGENIDKALLAGLLHDCAKCYSDEKKLALCEKFGVVLSSYELENTALIHAKLGAVLAREKYGVDDDEICHAILTHTTGIPGMNMLDKIIYIADYIEPHRNDAPNLFVLRKLAFTDLDETLRIILTDSLDYLNTKNKVIDPATRETYDFYCKKAEGDL